jgi:hypothetical protein
VIDRPAICWSLIVTPVEYWLVSSSAWTVRPVRVVVAAMVLPMTSWLVRGRPVQLRQMWQNSLCSMVFHYDVPGGK